jgi:glycosyltransferase involved in cell wall biosynthesis
MKVAFDARWLFQGGHGDVTYLRNLVRALAKAAPDDEFWLYYREFDELRENVAAQHVNVQTKRVSFPLGVLWNQCALVPRLARDGMALLHGNYVLPPLSSRPMVVSIHDITFRLFPQWIAPRPRRLMNILIPLSARRARRIITGSQCAKDDMVRELGVAPEKIIVTPYAAAPHFSPRDPMESQMRVREVYPQLSEPFIAGIGLRGVRKNIGVVLRALRGLQKCGALPTTKLALAGSREQFPDTEIDDLGDCVVFLGFVEESLLPDIYGAALCCVYPSLYEGFGLPVLEAMACGCPVLCSDTSSLPEVAGGAGALISPHDETAWAAILESVLHDENHRAVLRDRGLKRAAHFSWEKCARETLQIYREVCNE